VAGIEIGWGEFATSLYTAETADAFDKAIMDILPKMVKFQSVLRKKIDALETQVGNAKKEVESVEEAAKAKMAKVLEKSMSDVRKGSEEGSSDGSSGSMIEAAKASIMAALDDVVKEVKDSTAAVANSVASEPEVTPEEKSLKMCRTLRGDIMELRDELDELHFKATNGVNVTLKELVDYLKRDMDLALTVAPENMIIMNDDD